MNSIYQYYSLSSPTAKEEKTLWEKYFKWKYINDQLNFDRNQDSDILQVEPAIVSNITTFVGQHHDIISLIRRYSGLLVLGDQILEGAPSNADVTIDLYRRLQYSKEKPKNGDNCKADDICKIDDYFGTLFGEILNNIAFGTGHPSLVNKIIRAMRLPPADVKDQIYSLAIMRGLLPVSFLKLIEPKTPLERIYYQLESVPKDILSKWLLHEYHPFLLKIKLEGEQAFRRIIESHLRCVMREAVKYSTNGEDIPIDDLIQEGCIGLMRVAGSYSPSFGIRFMAYASQSINRFIERAIANTSRVIRLPVHLIGTITKLQRVEYRLTRDNGQIPTTSEIGLELGLTADQVAEIRNYINIPLSLESLIDIAEETLWPEDSDELIKDSDVALPDRLLYSSDPPLENIVLANLLPNAVNEVLSTLSKRQQRVISLRFGLEDGRSHTLEEVGREFKLSRERIRQIEAQALKRLRHFKCKRKLRDYMWNFPQKMDTL